MSCVAEDVGCVAVAMCTPQLSGSLWNIGAGDWLLVVGDWWLVGVQFTIHQPPVTNHHRLRPELVEISKKLQRLRIRERVAILHGSAVDDLADCQLRDLAADRARYVGDLNDLLRHVMRARVL